MQRNANEDLDSVMARFVNIMDKIYPEDQEALANQRDNLKKTAILSFTPDNIALPTLEEIKRIIHYVEP